MKWFVNRRKLKAFNIFLFLSFLFLTNQVISICISTQGPQSYSIPVQNMAWNSKVSVTIKSSSSNTFRPHTIRLQDKHDDLDMKALNIKGRLVDAKAYRQSFLDFANRNKHLMSLNNSKKYSERKMERF